MPAPRAPQPAQAGPRLGPPPTPPTPPPLSRFNAASDGEAAALLLRCCGSTRWASRVAACRPYPDTDALLAALDEASYDMTRADLVEALATESPQLPSPGDGAPQRAAGADAQRDRDTHVPSDERDRRDHRDQRGLLAAHTALRAAHSAYESRFGHAFLICLDEWPPGEQLGQALAGVRARLGNDPEEERVVVTEELRRLARGRLLQLVESAAGAG